MIGPATRLGRETLARVAASRRDLEGEALTAYAIVSARNVWASDSARSARRGELQHRLADVRQPEQPEDVTVAREEKDALREALASLSESERRVLLAREVEGVKATTLAEEGGSTPGAVPPGWAAPGPSSGSTTWWRSPDDAAHRPLQGGARGPVGRRPPAPGWCPSGQRAQLCEH